MAAGVIVYAYARTLDLQTGNIAYLIGSKNAPQNALHVVVVNT